MTFFIIVVVQISKFIEHRCCKKKNQIQNLKLCVSEPRKGGKMIQQIYFKKYEVNNLASWVTPFSVCSKNDNIRSSVHYRYFSLIIHHGGMVKWWNGRMAGWRNGGMAERAL